MKQALASVRVCWCLRNRSRPYGPLKTISADRLYTDATIYLTIEDMTEELEARILTFLERGPASPDEVSSNLGIAWATAQGYLLKLVGMGKVIGSRKGRVNVYFLNAPRRLSLKVPSWAKVKSGEELSEELAPYFPPDITAAEMVRKERRKA